MAAPKGNKFAKGNKGGGRPTLYKPEYAAMAFHVALLGATDEDLAAVFGIGETTLNSWKKEHEEFSDALKRGKTQADATVAASLYNRAVGYVGRKTVTATFQGQILDVQEVEEYVGPDTTAAIFWLKNRQRDKWRDRHDLEHTGKNGGPIKHMDVPIPVDPVEAAKVYREMMG